MQDRIADRLTGFPLHDEIRAHVSAVLLTMPHDVLLDLIDDPTFLMSDYDPQAGRTHSVPVAAPSFSKAARAVVLKRTVLRKPVEFVRWVIAHELAHAHLRNLGRFPGDDPEHAADALAAEWGWPKPAGWGW